MDENDLVYKGPWVRSAEQRRFQSLEAEYAFPGETHKTKIMKMWLEGYEYTDIERNTGHSFEEIRELSDMSERLVQEYLNLFSNGIADPASGQAGATEETADQSNIENSSEDNEPIL